jgi:hypothetical protein
LDISRQIELMDSTIIANKCIKICGKVLEKGDKQACREKHVPSSFVIDITRTLTYAKRLACNYNRTRYKT